MRRAGWAVAGVALATLALTAAVAYGDFTATRTSTQTLQSDDFLPPAASRARVVNLNDGSVDTVNPGKTYQVYAQVDDPGPGATGTATVTADMTTLSGTGYDKVALTAGSYTNGTETYNWRSAVQTASTGLAAGSKTYSLTMTDRHQPAQAATKTFPVTVTIPQVGATLVATVKDTDFTTPHVTTSTPMFTSKINVTYLILINRHSNTALLADNVLLISGPLSGIPTRLASRRFDPEYYLWAYRAKGDGTTGRVSVTFDSPSNYETSIFVVELSGNATTNPTDTPSSGEGLFSPAKPAPSSDPGAPNGEVVLLGLSNGESDALNTTEDFVAVGRQWENCAFPCDGFNSAVFFRPAARTTTPSFSYPRAANWGTIRFQIRLG